MTTAVRLRNVQLDVPADRYDATVAFWVDALGATPQAADGPFTHLRGPASSVGVHLQRLDDGPARIHLDLEAEHPEAAAEELVGRGATRQGTGPCGPVLADPAGLWFCICRTGAVVEELGRPGAGRAALRLVVIDVPRERFEDVLSFWSGVLDVEAKRFGGEFAAYAHLRDVPAPGDRLDLLVQDIGDDTARFHLDLHVTDEAARDAEASRLTALGAREVDAVRHWRTFEDPVGLLLCVVPDRHGDAT